MPIIFFWYSRILCVNYYMCVETCVPYQCATYVHVCSEFCALNIIFHHRLKSYSRRLLGFRQPINFERTAWFRTISIPHVLNFRFHILGWWRLVIDESFERRVCVLYKSCKSRSDLCPLCSCRIDCSSILQNPPDLSLHRLLQQQATGCATKVCLDNWFTAGGFRKQR